MSAPSIPLSSILKSKHEEVEGDEPKKKTREEWKKAKELEEARKAGTVPAAVDEEGKDINPHIPQYISTAPWYFGSGGPTLKHQRPQPEKQSSFNHLNEHYARGQKGSVATRYRKGACENCGGLGHKKKDCVERPRKVGAKFNARNIAADDVLLPTLKLDFDGKRDRWNGFNPADYAAVVEEHQKVEEYKRQLKAKNESESEEQKEEKRRKKLREALIRAKMEEDEAANMMKMDERMRKYNSMYNAKAPTEEEIEAYQLRRQREDDPMAAFLGK
ncbi:Pre-mRNA-splicing factor SLU7 [Penaeus vannamei]|uniref:Pre-mRNA-splicing factor SLU7 n=1 Tax=Penaeus vannamei TaxID=6689 RepID=A0A3R7PX22_PENVA|nr:Pre-mRNA-splicing factor SLU7 [Penaeus vannamei]